MARRTRSNSKEFQWRRSAGTTEEVASTFLAVDLFEQTREAFPNAGTSDACTVVAVKGYIRAVGASVDRERGRFGIRPCDRDDIYDQDPQHGPSRPGVVQTPPNTGAWNHWMFYGPFLNQGGSGVVGEATWNHAASPWAVDVQSKRVIRGLNMTLGLFIDTATADGLVDWDLSVGVLLS